MDVIYRKLLNQDIDQVKQLMNELVEEMAMYNDIRLSHPSCFYADNFFSRMSKYRKNNNGAIFVAEYQDKIIGYVIGYIRFQTADDLLEYKKIVCGYIPDIYVRHDHRTNGIGKVLIDMVENYLIRKGCDYIELSVAYLNKQARGFYKSRKYTEAMIEMRKLRKDVVSNGNN